MKAADIPAEDVLFVVAHIQTHSIWAMIWDVEEVLPGWPRKVLHAKLSKLVNRGLLNGCNCGCRGDYELTTAGADFLAENGDIRAVEAAADHVHGTPAQPILGRILERLESARS